MSVQKVTPPFGYRHRGRSGPYEEDPLEQLVLRVTRETVAVGGDLRAVAERLAEAVCFECGEPALVWAVVVPGGERTVPLCGKCAHWREPLGPDEDELDALRRVSGLALSASERFAANMMVAVAECRRELAAERAAATSEDET